MTAYRDPFPSTKRKRLMFDSFVNTLAGFGTGRDKVMSGYFAAFNPLDWETLQTAYYSDSIAARIVDKKVEHMLQRGFTIEETKIADELENAFELLEFEEKLHLAMTWGRLFGGAALIVGADDGLDPQYPLQVERVRSVRFLNVVDRRFVYPVSYYRDPYAPKFGEPEIYQVVSSLGGEAPTSFVHESRMLRFFGVKTDPITQRKLGGWGYSVLQRPYDGIIQFATSHAAIGQLLIDAGQAVFSIQGLMDMISADDTTSDGGSASSVSGATAVQRRMAAVDMERSAGRAIVLDKDGEEFKREAVQVAGIADLVDRLQQRLAADADMPVTLLLGRSPAGMNATGESDMSQWYDNCEAGQRKEVRPAILRMCKILTAGAFDGELCFAPIVRADPLKEEQINKMRADRWKVYIDAAVLHPEQVALAEFADQPIEIDVEAMKKAIELENEIALERKENPPPPPPQAPNGPNSGQDAPPQGGTPPQPAGTS